MPKIKIDGVELDIENGTSLLQACEIAGKEVANHNMFQNGQAFLDAGGFKGLIAMPSFS